MLINKTIYIQNIYYMLTYAFQVLKQTNYENISGEKFEDIENLFAVILYKGISQQIKQGLYREYVHVNDDLTTVRGKINLPDTIKNKINHKNLINCDFDEFSENNIYNQILKTTAFYLITNGNVESIYKKKLKKVMLYFNSVDLLDRNSIQWRTLQFNKSNKNYNMLINICYFILHDLLLSNNSGNKKVLQFTEEHMPKLFEKFVLEYYKKHYKNKLNISAAKIAWNIAKDDNSKFLPDLCTDITIADKKSGKSLIIDTKYYASTLATGQFNKLQLHRDNINQIFVYVKNKDIENTGNVAGMLLYAKTNEDIVPDETYHMSGNQISVKTLDLNKKFDEISLQLDNIVENFFNFN